MRVGFIGAGKVGCSLGKFFSEGGVRMTGYFSRHIESAKAAAEFTGTKCYVGIKELVSDSDAIFITVPDGVITEIFKELRKFDIRGKQICHCSGSISAAEAFPGIEDTGAVACSIHPLFPISDKFTTYRELTGAFFCLEGDVKCVSEWEEQLKALGVRTQIIESASKVSYHAGCAIASNLVCALMQESLNLLTKCGFTDESAREALTPLVKSNIGHVLNDGVVNALTGPVERNDIKTVQKHIDCFPTKKEKELYCTVSSNLIQIARAKHPETDFSEMESILREELINEQKYCFYIGGNEGTRRKDLAGDML
ncbi:Predicted oxidoreductase, contains short-chain dehydrogenase (SDR) and DUF2520 domains [Lachnospiraceae bacterium]|nr:Predicted oxidoreductase, contains short-chain dehydrogenase (SDR) and DUF2520 domains [Lachnospiraceae bacterium]